MNFKNVSSASSVFGMFLLVGCGSSSSTTTILDGPANDATIEIVDNTVIPAVNKFYAQTQSLDSSANTFCSTINNSNLTNLQNQWKQTSQAWYALLPFKFGPVEGTSVITPDYWFIDSYRSTHTDETSTVRTEISNLLSSSDVIADTAFDNKLYTKVGLLALEVAIFEVSANQSTDLTNIENEYSSYPRKCNILTGLANRLLQSAYDIKQGWTTNFAATGKSYRDMLVNEELEALVDNETGETASVKVVTSVQDYFDYLKNRSITTETGQLSSSIWQSLEASIPSIEEVILGTNETQVSFEDVMQKNGNSSDTATILSNLTTLETAIKDASTVDMKSAAGLLDGNFKRDLPDGLGITLGINFTDGD